MNASQTPARPASNELAQNVSNTRVLDARPLVSPQDLLHDLPASDAAYQTVLQGRQTIVDILNGNDPRLLVVCGPCSVHDPDSALEYAERFSQLRQQVSDRLELVMRVYFEKPRTTTGWKGLINDPDLNGSFHMDKGLRMARKLLLDINALGVPTATEVLEPFTPQYIGDLISWAAIGARTTESQTHRQMASGLSAPVGFKNSTDGNLQVAIDAMKSAAAPHNFLGINDHGDTAVITTTGNPDTHLILRGGSDGTNYGLAEVTAAADRLKNAGLTPLLMVDCSHANSGKKHERQGIVLRDLIQQIAAGRDADQADTPTSAIIGAMIESNLHEGNQKIADDMAYGVSVTDACIGWDETEALLTQAYEDLA